MRASACSTFSSDNILLTIQPATFFAFLKFFTDRNLVIDLAQYKSIVTYYSRKILPHFLKIMDYLNENIWSRICNIFFKRGFFYTIKRGIQVILRDARELQFDLKWRTNTRGKVFFSKDGANPLYLSAVHYEPTSPYLFKKIMAAIESMPVPKTFVDVGCGKGRALLLASEHGFTNLLGIEFDPDLAKMAEINVERLKYKAGKNINVEIVCEDAGTYCFPDQDAVFFFFNPFDDTVMRKTLENIRHSARLSTNQYIIYQNAVCDDLLTNPEKFEILVETKSYSVYRMII